MNKRIKAISEIRSRDEFERVINNTVTMQIAKERLELRRDTKILAIRQEFDSDINDLSEKMQVNVIRAEKYAAEHREDLLPGKKKSADTKFAFFGFRTGNPTLVLLNRKWTWAKVIDALKTVKLFYFVITKEAPDKDAMKAQMADEELAAVGTRIDQREVFFIDPKRDPADPQRLVSSSSEAREAA
jgi:phage host-nuclease inhibitor protein Gam